MLDNDNAKLQRQQGQRELSELTPSSSESIHPICQFATNQKKCEQFVERLEEAANNIDRRQA